MKPKSKSLLMESSQLHKYKVATDLMATKVDDFISFIKLYNPGIDDTTAILITAACLENLHVIFLSDPEIMQMLKELVRDISTTH